MRIESVAVNDVAKSDLDIWLLPVRNKGQSVGFLGTRQDGLSPPLPYFGDQRYGVFTDVRESLSWTFIRRHRSFVKVLERKR